MRSRYLFEVNPLPWDRRTKWMLVARKGSLRIIKPTRGLRVKIFSLLLTLYFVYGCPVAIVVSTQWYQDVAPLENQPLMTLIVMLFLTGFVVIGVWHHLSAEHRLVEAFARRNPDRVVRVNFWKLLGREDKHTWEYVLSVETVNGTFRLHVNGSPAKIQTALELAANP